MPVLGRLQAFITWKGWTQTRAAAEFGCNQGFLSQVMRGDRGVGLSLAHSIERVTKREGWPAGPIATEEWDTKAPKDADPATVPDPGAALRAAAASLGVDPDAAPGDVVRAIELGPEAA